MPARQAAAIQSPHGTTPMAASKPVRKFAKTLARKTVNRRPPLDATPRHLWLAALGLLVATRREVRHLIIHRRVGR
jgi:hypothetical protein